VVGLFRVSSRLASGGRWLAPPLGAAFYIRDGEVVKVLMYFSWSEALDVAGIDDPGDRMTREDDVKARS
jgi:hypothetical protein